VFDWDPQKALATFRRRGISFEEAATVLDDWQQVTVEDVEHSIHEQRWTTIGLSDRARLLVVTWTAREGRVRVISARRASKRERNVYER
jgi:uncharacterized DUF497 family protein